MGGKMDSKRRTAYLFTILATFTLLLLFMLSADSAFSAEEEKSLYIIHVSSLKSKKAAEVEMSKFLEQDLQAFYRYEAVEGKGNWYRVFIGTFNTRQEAKEKGAELVEKGIISYAAPRKVNPDFIPGRKTADVEIKTEEPVKHPVIEEEPSPVEVRQKPVAEPIEKTAQAPPVPDKKAAMDSEEEANQDLKTAEAEINAEESVKPPAIEEEPAPVEVSKKPVAKSNEKTVQESPVHEKKIEIDREKKVEYKPKREPSPEKSKFSLAVSGGAYFASNAEDFKITEQTLSADRVFFFTGDAYQISLETNLRAYKDLNIYGRVEYVFVDDVNILFISLGPKLRFNLSDSVAPYLKGGMVQGDFNFDNAPGEFDSGFGYEGGFGLDIFKSRFKVGLDLLYRNMEFDYIDPGIDGVTVNDSSIDASGLSISGTFTYFF